MTLIEKQIKLENEYREALKVIETKKPKELSFAIKDDKFQIVGNLSFVNEEQEKYVHLKSPCTGFVKIPVEYIRSVTEGLLKMIERTEE